jgi:HEAT repeat protein
MSHDSLESERSIFVLFRVETGRIQKIRTATPDCELDAGGLPFYLLTGVRPQESVLLLLSLVRAADAADKRPPQLAESALLALALHDDPSADVAFDQLSASSQPEPIREKASFWLGAARGANGLRVLRRMMQEEPSPQVREKVVFALSISREPDAIGVMIDAAKRDQSEQVRAQALFWLGQKGTTKAIGAISEAIENDPETEVKKKAVFALSQLPPDEGVPRLIQVAQTNKNPAVRKQAMFWLGQSKDPRALSFFEEILIR